MRESNSENFNHLKIHSQFSICEGAIKIDDLKDFSKNNKLKALGLCDTSNLCGALEFAEKLSKSGSQPIIGTQINFKLNETIGLLPLFALNEDGYKKIIKLSSLSFLKNDELSEPHLDFDELLINNEGLAYSINPEKIMDKFIKELLDYEEMVHVLKNNERIKQNISKLSVYDIFPDNWKELMDKKSKMDFFSTSKMMWFRPVLYSVP